MRERYLTFLLGEYKFLVKFFRNLRLKPIHFLQEYDYVFTVDLDEKGTLKLPYNITEDPWFAAQKFIHKNNLSQLFLDQVANFIVNNTKGMQLGTSTSNREFEDPFTGGGRYVPGSTGGGGFSGGAADPFTGGNAYTTSASQAVSSTSTSSQSTSQSSEPLFPMKEFLRFSTPPNYDALKKKLTEFVRELGCDTYMSLDKIDALLEIGKNPQWDKNTHLLVGLCLHWPNG